MATIYAHAVHVAYGYDYMALLASPGLPAAQGTTPCLGGPQCTRFDFGRMPMGARPHMHKRDGFKFEFEA